MADETNHIIVPTALAKAYNAARTQGRRAEAIRAIMNDRDVWDDICEDCCEVMEAKRDRAEAVQYALVQAMDLRCPCRDDLIAHQPRALSCDEVLNGACSRCGAKIVIEEVKQ